jgi:ribose-phosphate pyrophosphokinase
VFTTVLGTASHPGSQKLAGTPDAVHSVAPLLVRALARAA